MYGRVILYEQQRQQQHAVAGIRHFKRYNMQQIGMAKTKKKAETPFLMSPCELGLCRGERQHKLKFCKLRVDAN